MRRFYTDTKLLLGETITLSKELSQRLSKVLRYKEDQALVLFNGDGFDYNGVIASLRKDSATVVIKEQINKSNESSVNTVLLQGLCKFDRMDWAIQKAVEMGVNTIVPVLCEFTQIKQDKKRFEKKKLHWQSIIISACEQSGRSVIPKLFDVMCFEQAVDTDNYLDEMFCQKIVLHPYEINSGRIGLSGNVSQILLAVGPEGGFSNKEVMMLSQNEFIGLRLGNRILRAETATVAALTFVYLTWEKYYAR